MKNLPILCLLFLLTACLPSAVTEAPVTDNTPAPTSTPVPTATATLSPSPTPTESPEQEAARIAQELLGGNIAGLSGLDEQQRLSVISVLQDADLSVLAQAALDGNFGIAEITNGWSIELKMTFSEKITEIQKKKMPYRPVIWAERVGENYGLEIKPEWRGLKLVNNPRFLIQEDWGDKKYSAEEKVFNPDAHYWWQTIKNENDTGGLDMPDQLVAAFQEGNKIYYIDEYGKQQVFEGEFPSQKEVIDQMIKMNTKVMGKDTLSEIIESGDVEAYAGIMYAGANESDIMWNIDPVAIPKKSITVLIPVWNTHGELLYMRKCHLLFSLKLYTYIDKNGKTIFMDFDTRTNQGVFFGSGQPEDKGRLVLFLGLKESKQFGFVSTLDYKNNENVQGVIPIEQIQNPQNNPDLVVITLASLFVPDNK